MKNELIPEAPSPNVTTNIPFAFSRLDGMHHFFKYTCDVKHGVYIFDPVEDYADVMKNTFKKVEELRQKNMHKYNYKQITHFNPIFL